MRPVEVSLTAPRDATARVVSLGARQVLVGLGLFVAVLGVVGLGPTRTSQVQRSWPMDFDLNWVAAHRLVEHTPLYDARAARREGIDLVGPEMAVTSHSGSKTFRGMPPVALVHTPYLVFGRDSAREVFRATTFAGMLLAIGLACTALPRGSRLAAAVAAAGFVAVSYPIVQSLGLGQGNHLVMLALAIGFVGCARGRWGLAGVGLGLATVLKLSPVLLIVWLALERRWRAVASAAATAAALFAAAAAVGRAGDLAVWVRDISPSLSRGSTDVGNQSLVAWIGRMLTHRTDLTAEVGLGASRFAALAIAGAGLAWLHRSRRGRPVEPIDLSFLVLVVVLRGPLSWDHYATWALVGLVPILDHRRWSGLPRSEQLLCSGGLIAAAVLFAGRIVWPTAGDVRQDWLLRFQSGRYTVALLICLAVTMRMMVRASRQSASVAVAPA